MADDWSEPIFGGTLFDTFEYRGYFWIPENPDHKLPGFVRFTPTAIELDLLGKVETGPLDGTARPPLKAATVVGMTTNGRSLTLCNCTQVNVEFAIPLGSGSSQWVADYLLVGRRCSTEAELNFRSASISYLNLEEWVYYRPFPPPQEETNEIGTATTIAKHIPPKKETFEIPSLDCRIELTSSLSYSDPLGVSFRRQIREHKALLDVIPKTPQSLTWFRKRIDELQNLLTLLIGEPIFPRQTVLLGEEMPVNGHSVPEMIDLYFHPHFARQIKGLTSERVFAPFPFIRIVFDEMLKSWFAKQVRLKILGELFFGVLYNGQLYLRTQFLLLTQAVEVYCNQTQVSKYKTDDDYKPILESLIKAIPPIDKDFRESLETKLKYGNSFSLKKKIRCLLCTLDDETAALITPNRRRFADSVAKTRNYYTHFDPKGKDEAFSGGNLYRTTWRLRVLLTIVLLKEIGMEEVAIRHAFKEGFSRLAAAARWNYTTE